MRLLVDTNIFCRLVRRDDPLRNETREAVDLLLQQDAQLVITPQVEREFWVVATRPRDQNGLGLTPEEAKSELTAFEHICTYLPDTAAVHENWRKLVMEHGVNGKEAHDAGHVAAMLVQGIEIVLTFDGADFRRYDKLVRARAPKEILAELRTSTPPKAPEA